MALSSAQSSARPATLDFTSSVIPDTLRSAFEPAAHFSRKHGRRLAATLLLAALLGASAAAAQVLTIDTSGKKPPSANGPVDRQFQQIEPTHIQLSKAPLDTRTRLELDRIMQSEQGFAMRPLPRGRKGLTLAANGKLDPAGEAYLNMVTSNGISVKPGQRAVITNIKIERDKIVFDINGGPDEAHRFLRHVSVGMGDPDYENPVVADSGEPVGSRLTLAFKEYVPELTGAEVKALLAPLISFDVKTPMQAYTDTLPKPLKEAILDHQVLVGMNTDMVLFAKGQPGNKIREMDGQMPIEIWLYGAPPQDVTFVRINGNRVIRVEIAKVGQPVEVFTKDVVDAMMESDGKAPLSEQAENVHVIQEGDAHRNPDTQAPAPPPSLRNPGETLPTDQQNNGQVMKPVHFPQPDQNPDDQQSAQQSGQPSTQQSGQQTQPSSSAPPSTPSGSQPASPSGSPSGSGASSTANPATANPNHGAASPGQAAPQSGSSPQQN